MRSELFTRLRETIASWDVAPVHASVFGSMARGQGDTSSDIDIFLVRPNKVEGEDPRWREQVDVLARQVQRWTGNRAGISEVSKGALARLRKEDPPILAELRADAITIAGTEAMTWLGSA
jgi:hypothetical protein